MKLSGKVAVVTGAASGIGEAIAKRFAAEGARVVATDIAEDGVQKVVDEIVAAGGEAIALKCNVASEEDVARMIDTAVEKYGTLDVLVNNAGIMDNFMPTHEMTDELWERVFAINVTGTMRAMRKALPIFLEKKSGSIINIASVAGVNGARGGVAYTSSKHAVVGMTKNVGFQYATSGIRCNAIAPGAIETNIGATITEPSEFGMGRFQVGAASIPAEGRPEQIAGAALFLASDEASFVNGAVLLVDAGWSAY